MKQSDFNSLISGMINKLSDRDFSRKVNKGAPIEMMEINPYEEELKQLWEKIKAICILNDVRLALPQYKIKNVSCFESRSVSEYAEELYLIIPKRKDNGQEESLDINLNVRIFKRKPDGKIAVRFTFDEALLFIDTSSK